MAVVTPLNNFLGPEGDTVIWCSCLSVLPRCSGEEALRRSRGVLHAGGVGS